MEKVFLIIERSPFGFLEVHTPENEEGLSTPVTLSDEFIEFLVEYLENDGFPAEFIQEIQEAGEVAQAEAEEERRKEQEED